MKRRHGRKLTLARDTVARLEAQMVLGGYKTDELTICMACPDTWEPPSYSCGGEC